jgi:hypothetical protein
LSTPIIDSRAITARASSSGVGVTEGFIALRSESTIVASGAFFSLSAPSKPLNLPSWSSVSLRSFFLSIIALSGLMPSMSLAEIVGPLEPFFAIASQSASFSPRVFRPCAPESAGNNSSARPASEST